ncbi:MAG: tyrosine-type recombinase/integrase [Actinomycetota bacterium]|nr:tyrosine-type recombinase/integrase [Actinomycetota bacterium]
MRALAGAPGELAPATQARRRSAIRGFLDWVAEAEAAPHGLSALLGATGREPGVPPATGSADQDAVAAVLAAIPLQADRDQLLFGLMARAGLRPGEALALELGDFDEAAGVLRVRGWGGTARRVLVEDPQLGMRLVNWRRSAAGGSGPMFPSPAGVGPLRYASVLERWARYQHAAGVEVRLGDLRRAHAAALLAGGVPEWVVRARIGQPRGQLAGGGGDEAAAEQAMRDWRARTAETGASRAGAGDADRAARRRSKHEAG